MKRGVVSVILVVMMLFQSVVTFAALPSEVTSSKQYVTIPVYFQGKNTPLIVKELSKTVEGKTLKGKAIFYMRAFAYETGDQIKIGTQINFIGSDGKLKQEWWDQNITTDKSTINWPQCNGVIVEVNDDIDFVSKTQNINETRVTLSMTVLGNTFSRATENIKLDANFGGVDITLKAYNADNTLLDTFISSFVGDESTNEKIFASPIIVDPGAKVGINVKGEFLESQEYTILKVEDEHKPILPLNNATWSNLGDLEKKEPNMWESYPDLLKDKKGYLSTKHYNYKYGEKSPTSEIPSRANTFCYPVGEDNVFQLAKQDSKNQYHSTEEEAAFFSQSYNGQTELEATFIPTSDVSYQFSVYCNDYRMNEYTPEVKVKNNSTNVKTTLVKGVGNGGNYYHGYQGNNPYVITYDFKAGNTYTFHCKWKQKQNDSPVPSLFYRTASNQDAQQGWELVPSGFFESEKYIGGANKAVKFWGYMAPSGDDFKDGTYHLGSYADDGIYGYIMIDNEKIEFAENWDLSAAANRTGVDGKIIDLELKKDMVYPIYMEWYEGRPTEKSFIPRFKEAGSNNWKDIPQDWFYASADSTPGEVNMAYFDSYVADSEVKLPEEPGVYYVAVKVKTEYGNDKQVLQGPFKIEKFEPTLPSVNENTGSLIVPTSVSNIFFKTDFTDYAKGITYTIDLEKLVNEEIIQDDSTTPLLNLDEIIVSAVIKQTASGMEEVVDQGNYEIEVVTTGGKRQIKITFETDFCVIAGSSQDIKIYFQSEMGGGVKANEYSEFLKNIPTSDYEVTVEAYPGYEKQTVNTETGVVTSEIIYLGTKVANSTSVSGIYKEMPTIH